MKVRIQTDDGIFGPINEGPLRTFWGYGLIPKGTLVIYGNDSTPVAIETCSKLNAFPKRLPEDAAYFNSKVLLSQKAPVSRAQVEYLHELGWPFPVKSLNYYQVDFLRKRLEEAFPDRRRPFIDPDNPWSPGSTSPLNLTSEEREERRYAWKRLPATNRQLKFLRFFGMSPDARVNRGTATSLITRILSETENRKRWIQYKLLTEDIGDESAELRPFDRHQLTNVQIPFDTELSDSEARHAVVKTIRGRKKQMWNCLNSTAEYWAPWLEMADMDAITKKAGIAALFEAGDIVKFKHRFIEELQSYSSEIADREKRHRL